jgi:glutamate-ammonia-ligase adenylyltransferase
MGKFGGRELNFSSDIDLIYLYETERGMTEGGRAGEPVTLHEYFVRLCEIVTRILSEVTEDGFVFRVDLRLRPDGTKGDLANSLRSAEVYYESWGQTWERAVMIKARPVAGDAWIGEQFLGSITPFVYRKYLDFTSLEEIKEMKDRVDIASARARRHARDLKLGAGGIREIEFFAQAHQLIYGGKNPDLRLRGTVETLRALVGAGIVSQRDCDTLTEAYTFLRSLEHRIQVYQDRQTHALPEREEDLLRLARTMGLPDARALDAAVDRHTGNVRAIYDRLFRAAPAEAGPEVSPDVLAVLYPISEEEDIGDRLSALRFRDLEAARRNVAMLRDGPPFIRMPARARRYLGKIAPLILSRVVLSPDPDMALHHTERFLSAVGARTMFYALLFENRQVIDVLVRLFGSSRYLSGYLLRHPELLDTLLRKDLSPPVKTKSDLRKELGEMLAGCADYEQELDELRRFKNMEMLRVGMNDLAGNLSLEEGMFQLSALAEVLLSYTLVLAQRATTRRFGVPMVADGGEPGREAEFCVLGMGKLGAEELSYHSDLDIIFLYSGAGETVPAPGQDPADFRKLSNHEYFAKVAQRLISILTTVTREGYVYRLDTRLRPSGNAGPLVSFPGGVRTVPRAVRTALGASGSPPLPVRGGGPGVRQVGGADGRPGHLRPSSPPRCPGRDQPPPEAHGDGAGERASGPAKPQGGARGDRRRRVRRAVPPAPARSGQPLPARAAHAQGPLRVPPGERPVRGRLPGDGRGIPFPAFPGSVPATVPRCLHRAVRPVPAPPGPAGPLFAGDGNHPRDLSEDSRAGGGGKDPIRGSGHPISSSGKSNIG